MQFSGLNKIRIRLRESKGFHRIDSNHTGKCCNREWYLNDSIVWVAMSNNIEMGIPFTELKFHMKY